MARERIRGRQVLLLLTCALPLTAEDDVTPPLPSSIVPSSATSTSNNQDHPNSNRQQYHNPVDRIQQQRQQQHQRLSSGSASRSADNANDDSDSDMVDYYAYDNWNIEQQAYNLYNNDTPALWDLSSSGLITIDYDWTLLQKHGGVPPLRQSSSLPQCHYRQHTSRRRNLANSIPNNSGLASGTDENDNTTRNDKTALLTAEAGKALAENNTGKPCKRSNMETSIDNASIQLSTDKNRPRERKEGTMNAQNDDDAVGETISDAAKADASEYNEKNASEIDKSDSIKEGTSTPPTKRVEVDYASKSAGALILEQSNNFQGASHLLEKDKDRYAIVPCDEPTKYVVVGLSEDILVKSVVLANYERYSSHTKDFNIAGRSTTVGEWNDLGTYSAEPLRDKQTFHLTNPTWARYLKIQFLTHYGNEDYCTMSQISVHGSTMLQGFHEQWGADDNSNNNNSNNDGNESNGDVPVKSAVKVDENTSNDVPQFSDHNLSMEQQSKVINESSTSNEYIIEMCRASEYMNYSFDFCPSDFMNDFEKNMLLLAIRDETKSRPDSRMQRVAAFQSESVKSNQDTSSCGPDATREGKFDSHADTSEVAVVGESNMMEETEDGKQVVDRIKKLIRSTAGAVDEIGNSLLHRATPSVDPSTVPHHQNQQQQNGSGDSSKVKNDAITKSEHSEEDTSSSKHGTKNDAKAEIKQVVSDKKKTETDSKGLPTSTDKVDTSDAVDNIVIDESNFKLTSALKRFPSAKCLETINFHTYKNGIMTSRVGGSGSQNTATSGNAMEPIFKKLTDEIKTLQASMLVHDQFAKEAVSCYQSIIVDLIVEMETVRIYQDSRIGKLEKQTQAGAWVGVFFRDMVPRDKIRSFIELKVIPMLKQSWSVSCTVSALLVVYANLIIFDRQSVMISWIRWCIGMFLVSIVLYSMGLRVVWRPSGRSPASTTSLPISPNTSNESNGDISLSSVSYTAAGDPSTHPQQNHQHQNSGQKKKKSKRNRRQTSGVNGGSQRSPMNPSTTPKLIHTDFSGGR